MCSRTLRTIESIPLWKWIWKLRRLSLPDLVLLLLMMILKIG